MGTLPYTSVCDDRYIVVWANDTQNDIHVSAFLLHTTSEHFNFGVTLVLFVLIK